MRAAKIFVEDLQRFGILDKVAKLKIGLYGSLAATGKGHMTPEAIMMGLEGDDPETIECVLPPSSLSSISRLLMQLADSFALLLFLLCLSRHLFNPHALSLSRHPVDSHALANLQDDDDRLALPGHPRDQASPAQRHAQHLVLARPRHAVDDEPAPDASERHALLGL